MSPSTTATASAITTAPVSSPPPTINTPHHTTRRRSGTHLFQPERRLEYRRTPILSRDEDQA
ncbi:hypothetical protein M405DRAFT_832075 [Rhizopogon salebrosus TDB-379]|nr:hypothetical protein M405DRAFT_832075 [Rhizopogon salebrosus TDB-379]